MHLLFAILLTVDPYQPPPVEYEHPPVAKGPATQKRASVPVVKAAENKRLYFKASWCLPCLTTGPHVKAIGGITVLDFDENAALAQSYGVTALPAFVCVEDGNVRMIQGSKTRAELRAFYGTSPAPVSLPPGPPAGVAPTVAASAGFHYVGGKLVDSDGAVVTEIDGKAVAQQAKSAPVRQVRTAGWHTHTCDRCGNSWSHGREANGNRAMHTCGVCGRVEWN